MEWLDRIRGKTVGLDTSPLIYFIEESPKYLGVTDPFFEALGHGEFQAVTSTVTLLEVLVHPLRNDNPELAKQYREILLNSANLTVLAVSRDIAEEAAQIRAKSNIRTPDAIQIATALYGGASFFLTNDLSLKTLPYLTILTLDSLLPNIGGAREEKH